MGGMLISYQNFVDEGVLRGGGWEPSLPLENLAHPQLSHVARSIDAAPWNTEIILDMERLRDFCFVALLNHNMSPSARWRISASHTEDFAAPVYITDKLDMWSTITPFGAQSWGDFEWGGKPHPASREPYGADVFHIMASDVLARYVKVEIFDNKVGSYRQLARLIVGPVWRPSINLQYGWSVEQVDESRSIKSRGGQIYVGQQPRFRRLSFTLEDLKSEEMFGPAYEMERIKGRGGEVMVIVDPDNIEFGHCHAIYGFLAETTPTTNPYPGRFAKEFVVEELI